MVKQALYGILSLALVCAIFLPSAEAPAKDKNLCKNKNTTPVLLGGGKYECRHKSAYYEESCPFAYVGGKCVKRAKPQRKCPVGQKLCRSGYCVAVLKACKTSNHKSKPAISCPSPYKIVGDKCESVVGMKIEKCPVGFKKSALKSSGPNGSKTYYCSTSL